MKKIIMSMMLCSLLGTAMAQKGVSNIRVQQHDTVLLVMYDLAVKADIEAYVSFDNGSTYRGPLKHVSGSVGKGLAPENNKVFVWNIVKEVGYVDCPNTVIKIVSVDATPEVTTVPKVTIEKTPKIYPQKTFFEANFSCSSQPQRAFGFTAGQFTRMGWYVSLMSNFNFTGINSNLESNGNGNVNMGRYLPFYSGNTSTTRISITSGFVNKLTPSVAWYAGLGFGHRALFWETTDHQWIKNKLFSTTGIDMECGVLFDLDDFILSFGVVTSNFVATEFKIGIGFAIPNQSLKK